MIEFDNDDLALINSYSRKELSEEEVYIFNVTLCDNDIDRDFEKFSKQSLEKLSELFLGKTGFFDHNMNMKSEGQSVRIFKTWIDKSQDVFTFDGQPYCSLKAKAYMIIKENNKELIEEIEGEIINRASIGCSIKSKLCSICGHDKTRCLHIGGRKYNGKKCFYTLEDPINAYEWSLEIK